MFRNQYLTCLLVSLTLIRPAKAAERSVGDQTERHYTGGFATVLRLGMDLQRMMDSKYRPDFPPNPIFVDLDLKPTARPAVVVSGTEHVSGVMLSAGFIDLANNVAHAAAIDESQPGFFERYLAQLSQENGTKEIATLPDLTNETYWTETIRNKQLSDFNQIVGMVVAINLAHIYLGQYEKYSGKLQDSNGQPIPLARLMSHREWLKAMRKATKNALDAGLGMSGYIALCEAIDHMPARPPWTEFFIPKDMKASKLRSELRILEANFFSGISVD